MYENRHARFTAVGPLLASGSNANPQTFNRYVYVTNSPLMFTDPTGWLETLSRKTEKFFNGLLNSGPGSTAIVYGRRS